MIFTTTEALQNYLISQPETGMGYQVLSPSQKGLGAEDLIIVLNAQIAIEFKDLKNNQNKSLSYSDIKDYNIINSTQLDSFSNHYKMKNGQVPLKIQSRILLEARWKDL